MTRRKELMLAGASGIIWTNLVAAGMHGLAFVYDAAVGDWHALSHLWRGLLGLGVAWVVNELLKDWHNTFDADTAMVARRETRRR